MRVAYLRMKSPFFESTTGYEILHSLSCRDSYSEDKQLPLHSVGSSPVPSASAKRSFFRCSSLGRLAPGEHCDRRTSCDISGRGQSLLRRKRQIEPQRRCSE